MPNTSHNKINGGMQTTKHEREITTTNKSDRMKAARFAAITTLFAKFVFIICKILKLVMFLSAYNKV